MDDLLKVPEIVTNIASYLSTVDYLSFQQVNKRVYAIINGKNDSKYWSLKLTRMGLQQVHSNEEEEITLLDENDDQNSLRIFELYKSFTAQNSKKIFVKFYRCYNSYARKLYNNNLANFFPTSYSNDPLKQTKILNFIKKYNFSNKNDIETFTRIETNFNILREIFINSVLKESELNYQSNNLAAVARFMKILLISNEESNAIEFFKSKADLPPSLTVLPSNDELFWAEQPREEDSGGSTVIFNSKNLDTFLNQLRDFLNEKIKLADILFKDEFPVILQFIESFIQDILLDILNNILLSYSEFLKENGKDSKANYECVPELYFTFIKKFDTELNDSVNAGANFRKVVRDLLNLYLEPFVVNYMNQTTRVFESFINSQLANYDTQVQDKQREQNAKIYNTLKDQTDASSASNNELPNDLSIITETSKTVPEADSKPSTIHQSVHSTDISNDKLDFLSSFTKIFKFSNNENQRLKQQLQLAYNLNLISNNLQNIKSLISLDLCYKILQETSEKTDQIYKFHTIESLLPLIKLRCQEIFKILITQLNKNHVRPAFEKAILLLQKYNPNEIEQIEIKFNSLSPANTQVEPLVQFTELINIGDIILQMISIFYKNELIPKKIIDKNKDFLNDVIQLKKNFETSIDDFVAEGLNIGINKLMDEISFVFKTLQLPDDYNPPPPSRNSPIRDIKPTKCAIRVVELLSNHCFLLTGATDKGTIDVYQQEIGERFFNEIVKHLKKCFISTEGAIWLICDLNYFYDFIANKLKQKNVVPYFVGLKSIGQLYIISGKDSKELGKLISDLGKFNGIFTQEEIYEFVQRRSDWVRVRKDVEKVMYGLGIRDCCIM
ncbi:AQG_2a_G0028300.mRNA.1.CDS.1 [Saccharomyces cerevisiae]|uniref:YJL204Cp-like protein n=4 Tax=Saccharomyces cerevisiae TaxID=4932 RepID=B5VKY7_YEAS6|nr:Rcy1p [Saccharomyces cerevisiae YJM993]AJP39516.1 Rcy1p [Saccharomyces cerevisiae YJM1078]AJR53786.1 Rcy1p [Saccharomyces cerevisiae YJM681]AJR55409.1 Rcy1p [Saccharomyces cerevisiae YJM969]AJR55737.1 Rcy1p [Saccharomyces cerevisiae YJM972]AJR56066.1 Rcy1p [Saccharomyces cerevisiae YJM975]AJR56391.1 Rcy1p [Saccharomyces cerevisiae YJM978]AJR56718.1 Rcy1p [Saccharomyces cerevisiae YJM981]AJR57046.1 Rcy1p [Saccharomyces cerevisiae YJM984]AJR57375.1 Rcy1p [Saccharomyces cerevisiae YJM987]